MYKECLTHNEVTDTEYALLIATWNNDQTLNSTVYHMICLTEEKNKLYHNNLLGIYSIRYKVWH